MEMSSSQPSHIIYEKEAAIEIDYNTLEEGKCAIIYAIQFYIPYARHYKPRLVYFLPHFQRPFLCF